MNKFKIGDRVKLYERLQHVTKSRGTIIKYSSNKKILLVKFDDTGESLWVADEFLIFSHPPKEKVVFT